MTKQSDLRKRVYCYMKKHHDKPKKFISDHFMSEGVSKTTIYRTLKGGEQGFEYIRRVDLLEYSINLVYAKLKRLFDHSKEWISTNMCT